jgi:two-component system nitrogen regulation sensor histidine kinase NtrY
MQRFLQLISFVLFVAIVVLLLIQYGSKDSNKVREHIEGNLKKVLDDQHEDLMNFTEQFGIYSNPFDISSENRFIKRVFVDGSLVYWSDNAQIGSYLSLRSHDSLYTYKAAGDIYLVRRATIENNQTLIEIYTLLPLLLDPPIKNQYLSEKYNIEVFESYKIKLGGGDQTIQYENLQIVLNIKPQPLYQFDTWILLISFTLGAILIWLLWFFTEKGLKDFSQAVLRISGLLVLRGLFWVLTTQFINTTLFNPIYYTSSYASSIGDLLLHSVLIYILIQVIGGKILKLNWLKFKWLYILFVFILIHFAYFSAYKICWNILNNSLISLDISETIQFDLLRIVAQLILIFWAVIFFKVVQFSVRIHRSINPPKPQSILIYFVIMIGAMYFGGAYSIVFFTLLAAAYWFIQLLDFDFAYTNLDYRSVLFVSLLIALISAVFTLTIYQYYEKEDLISKKKFANRLLIKNDFLGEYYLNEKIEDIKKDTYIRSRLSNRLLAKRNIEEKIKSQYLSSYFDKYDVEVYLYDAAGVSFDDEGVSYDAFKNLYVKDQYKTDYEQIYFFQDKEGNIQDKYFCFIPVVSFDRNVGFVVLSLTLKKYIPVSVFPQLMVESSYYFSDENRFDYSVYREGKLLYKRGRFEFQNALNYPDLTNPNLFEKGIVLNGVHFYGLQTTEGKTFVIASPVYSTITLISNFSFLYLLILFCFAILFTIERSVDKRIVFNLSTKIQLYLGLSLIVPMLVVSIALLNTLNQSYKEEIDKSSSKRAYNISEYLVDACERFFNNEINRDDLNSIVSRVASLLQTDINLYGSDGRLLVSSEVEIFNSGLLGTQIAPAPYNAIKYGNTETKIYKQSIGDLVFRVSYVGLRSHKNGKLLGILSLPYFDSKYNLAKQQVEVFNSLISIFTIIFLLSVIIGNLAIERLIKPLKVITERLKMTDLKEVNEPINYTSKDEIGILINEYNTMIKKLEESKIALAESQKESAWQEIARQVAHEIKNPLTPMRLKIQQMMRQKSSDDPEYKSLNSLIGQIDTLSSIADSFSAFAKMPAPRNERFNLTELIESVAEVHIREGVVIDTVSMSEAVFVHADMKIFAGILNNIIINAIQATSEKTPNIKVSLEKKSKKVLISVEDNGQGIAEENKEKIFTPYFSTKLSGSGIGLAVAKKGIENAGGNIWFETKLEEGTTFFVSLPIVS